MSKREISSFALKIMGILCIILSIASLENLTAYAIYSISNANTPPLHITPIIFSAFVPFTLLLLSGILLMKKSKNWAERFFTQTENEPKAEGISVDDARMLGFSLIGLLLLAFTIPKLFKIIVSIAEIFYIPDKSAYMNYFYKDIIFVLIQIVIGLYLFIGSAGLNKLWHAIQKTRGLRRIDS